MKNVFVMGIPGGLDPKRACCRIPLRRHRRVACLLAACGLTAGTIAWRQSSTSPVERALDRLLAAPLTIWRAPPETFDNFNDRDPASSMSIILRSGTNCVPYLCREVRRRETAFNRFCLAQWPALPGFLARIVPKPVSVRVRRLRAITLLQCLGSGAVRPATGTLIETLSDPTPEIAAQAASALGLVLPESRRAREAFVAYFQSERGGEFLGADMWDARFWKDIPELLPQLVHQLANPYRAGDAARALEACDTRAAVAVPALIRVADEGFAGRTGTPEQTGQEGMAISLATEARCNALSALAKTGVRDDRVMEAFYRAWTNASFPMLRCSGAIAIASCGETAAPLVSRLTATLNDEDAFTLLQKINTLGRLGSVARAALPELRAYEGGEFPPDSPKGVKGSTARDIRFAATLAICMIAPAEASARLNGVVAELGERDEAARYLASLKCVSSKILPLMRARLLAADRRDATRAAFVILRLDPDDTDARATLVAGCESRDLLERLSAARLLFEATHDVVHTLPVYLDAMQRPELRFEAVEGIRACGAAVRPQAPRLAKLLWYSRGEIRQAAGDILRAIAPETLPPINDRTL